MKVLQQKYIGIILLSALALLVAIIDVTEIDNSLYYLLKINPRLAYYDLRLWDFYQGIGAVGALLFGAYAAYKAYETWLLESAPTVHAVGVLLISLTSKTNKTRDSLMVSHNTLQLVNVGRGPAKNVSMSVSSVKKGFLLEDFCPDTFSIAGNSGTKGINIPLQVHGQRFVKGNEYELAGDENQRRFYIHYQDHSGKEHITRVTIDKVNKGEGDLGRKLDKDSNLQLWKIMRNEDL